MNASGFVGQNETQNNYLKLVGTIGDVHRGVSAYQGSVQFAEKSQNCTYQWYSAIVTMLRSRHKVATFDPRQLAQSKGLR